MAFGPAIVRNRLLAGMPPESFDCLRPHLKLIELKQRAVLQEHNHPIEHIFFLERGVASLFARTQHDGPVAVSIVGPRGFVGVAAVLGKARSPNRCVMEVPGEALTIPFKDLSRVMDRDPVVRQHLLIYVHALLIQNTQAVLCNVRHGVEERLCRWLLLAADRLNEDVIPLTHEQLATILGVRRAGVTTALQILEETGVIAKTRGAIRISDRSVLEKKACECYRIITSEYSCVSHMEHHEHSLARAMPSVERASRVGPNGVNLCR